MEAVQLHRSCKLCVDVIFTTVKSRDGRLLRVTSDISTSIQMHNLTTSYCPQSDIFPED